MGTFIATAAHPACNTNAIGVEDCRQIEYARCDAALHCSSQFAVDDPAECKRFYRDHCLHGMAAPANANDVKSCIRTIEQLGACAKDNGPKSEAATCGANYADTKQTVCALLAAPEVLVACAFLGGVATPNGQAGASSQAATTAAQTGGSSSAVPATGGVPGLDSLVTGAGGVTDLLGLGGLPF